MKFITALHLYGILFVPISVTLDPFDFKEVVRQNKRVGEQMVDKCARRKYQGNRANSRELPYQVTVRKEFDSGRQWWSVCGGAIITSYHIITVAHCFSDVFSANSKNLQSYRVIAGTTRSNVILYGDMQQRRGLLRELKKHLETWMTIAACHKHLNYSKDVEDVNNLAVLQLTDPIVFSETIKAIRMITDDTFYAVKLKPGSLCLVSGYGAYEMFSISTFLKMTCIPIVDFKKCKKDFYSGLKSNITQMCAGSTVNRSLKMRKSTCTGDAGGPLVCQGLLVGVVSYLQGNCYSTPGIYTLLSAYTIAPSSPFKLVSANGNIISLPNFGVLLVSSLTIMYYHYKCLSTDISSVFY